ncbi:unnamed protein product [Symbiodinium microadriaticum]|nr:unnamed protein product [Symbiodinium microadriaticum]
MERFVHRGWDGRVLDVDEFQVAKALLTGEADLLSQEVDGQHLFDWCCHFGHQSTAAAMVSFGVQGCVFKGPHSLPPHRSRPVTRRGSRSTPFHACHCSGWSTCKRCSWGFPENKGSGIWVEQWDASLEEAKNAAKSAATIPVVRALLEAFRSQAAVDGLATAEGMAYLLDVAILIGDAELARCCAQHCTRMPLRRWRGHELVRIFYDDGLFPLAEIQEKDILIAALAAGLQLKDLRFSGCTSVSLGEAIVLSPDAELWHRVQGLQLQLGPWPAHREGNQMARFLLEPSGGQVRLSSERLHRAQRAGLALSSFQAWVPIDCQRCGRNCFWFPFSLLDLAILFGQSDCAELCGSMDIEATKVTLPASLEAMPIEWEDEVPCNFCRVVCTLFRISDDWAESIASLPERQAAAAEALRAALQASRRKIAASAGFGLFQTMRSWARGKSVPMALVNLVLAFAAERPSLLQALEGREWELPPLGHWWEESERRAQPVVEDPEPHAQAESLGVAERQPAGAGTAASSSNDMQAQPDGTSEKESGSDQDTTNDLLTALRNSKSDNPPLSGDGVVIFRLTRKAHAEEVNAVLFDATGPLWPLHRRVLEAGCEVAPEWSPIKALFVPLTQPQLQELAQGNIYELGKVHLLALQSDAELLTEAFNGELQRSVRPKLRRETPRRDDEEEGARDHEPLLVMEGGIHDGVRTDSDLGYPVYEA